MKLWLTILATVMLQGPVTAGFLLMGNYSSAALAATTFVFGALFGYMAALHLEQPPPPAPRVDSQPPPTQRDLVVYEVTGRDVL